MPRNVEIKARVDNMLNLLEKVQNLSQTPCKMLIQDDLFFNVTRGRLKLRVEINDNNKEGWLIFYERPDVEGPKLCHYRKWDVTDTEGLREILTLALGERCLVRKARSLFMVDQTRIHVDTVENLGSFMELEVCLSDDQTEAMGQEIAKDLMEKLGVKESDLVDVAYADLLQSELESNTDGVVPQLCQLQIKNL